MILLHIAHVSESRLAGVDVAVPAIVQSQQTVARAALLNLTNAAVSEVSEQLTYTKGMGLDALPEPFCKPDLIVFHEIYRQPFLSLAKQARAMGIPYVIVPHGGLTKNAQRIKAYKKIPANLLLFDRFIRGAAAVQCLSERELEQTSYRVPKFVGSNGVAVGDRKIAFSPSGLRFAYIGRMDVHIKGLDLLLEALGRERAFLLDNGCRVDLYGPDVGGSRAKLLRLRRKYGLEKLVYFHDAVTGEEKRRVLDSTDCYIQTSRSEGMSMGILEALGCGIPCVVTEGTGMARLVEEADAGWGCENDAASIAGALKRAVLERARIPEKSGNARALAQKRFSWERVAAQTIERYRALINQAKECDP